MSRRSAIRSPRFAVVLTLLLAAGCSRQHGPEGADTVTNWLASCQRDSECKGEAVCINALCSLPCSQSSSSACTMIDEGASCAVDLGVCDLACEVSASCQVLGPAFFCLAGRCRMTGAEDDAPPGDDGTSDAERARNGELIGDSQALAPTWSISSIASRNETSFTRTARVELSDYVVESGAPRAAWHMDHWQVAWPVRPAPMLGNGIEVASLFPAGRLTTERYEVVADRPVVRRVYNGLGRTVAYVAGDQQGPCFVAFSDLDTGSGSEALMFDCNMSLVPVLAPVPESDDWFVARTSFSAPATEDELPDVIRVGRYATGPQTWTSDSWQIAAGGASVEGLETMGLVMSESGDVWGWGPSPVAGVDGIYRLRPRPAQPDRPNEPLAAQFDIISGWIHALIPVPGGTRVVQSLRQGSTELYLIGRDASGGPLFARALPSVEQVPRDVTYIPERGLFALCTVEEEVRVHIVDDQGVPIGEPMLVNAKESNRIPFGCALAWSGSELLAVWTMAEVGVPFSPAPFTGPMGKVQAKIVSLPQLDR